MELAVQKRDILGRKTQHLRKKGLVPAELYGRGLENLHLSLFAKEFKKVFKEAGENTIVNVVVGGERHPVLIQEISYHPVSDEIESVDFYQVRMDEKLKVKVPLEFIGTAPAVKEKNGILVKAMQEVEVEALPADIPREFKISLSNLTEIGQSIYVKDLDAPVKVKILVSSETVLATVTAKITEEEELAMQKAGTVEEVKVETEEKKAERDATKAAIGEAAPAAETKTAPGKEASKVGKEAPKK
ncbi:MAG: hypothetical protein A3I89_01730 [Candidatus Harrisonbacteria bacterium RIFCSPLOWO2_02_FULL_41_11]|uniref:Large ribosomal subunit protein bL25 n=1 Tax=Candidatus Harrisonbacteria bacterium RIFCSPHIGHO2_02_FULL_42_16 TaxID=1798404 RepID=A0A1G1ZHR4_9BACT|nr:MAG: hypothetical protein A3B92_02080 [Candidatus Harrisonbacteria bacterium RIFCSPHIGHO2_02_FULL_42_16]OGY65585.1 MAG: hypothetical protein A3I89_01730 [Candidatus Harrisonbacteria bacterium RIFCSPLOWO2_02_FULL_41_11]